jgi:RNA polymerase I-specific transcription initiation factor RRN7
MKRRITGMRRSKETSLLAMRLRNGRSRQGNPSMKAQYIPIPAVSLHPFGPRWVDCDSLSPDYYGERADFHYLACLQLLLRKQVAAITKLWSLPPEFEAISRDVWSLALTLKGEIPHIDNGNGEHERDDRAAGEASSDDDNDSEGDDSDSEGSESENHDASLTNLLNRLSEDDDSEVEQPPIEPQPMVRSRGRGLVAKFPYYVNVAVLLVSCWILRLPVMSSDVLK